MLEPGKTTLPDNGPRRPRGPFALALFYLFLLAAFLGFVTLGNWQVHRRAWKLDLIARVDQRVHAVPSAPPPPSAWPTVSAERDEYRHVRLHGRYVHTKQTLVTASTDLGSGYWVLTPLLLDDGSTVLVNRGYVPPDWCGVHAGCPSGPTAPVEITGLLRISEPHAFLRQNDPVNNRWYSRDVQGIAHARQLRDVAPYFVDADATAAGDAGGWPRGGLTVIHFPNSHLSYLITWYLLALMVALAGIYLGYDELRLRRAARTQSSKR